jgi:AbrB family looped-hinge helix DNA binding protein
MKIGERGQVTIPKQIREQLGLAPHTEVEFEVVKGEVVLRKKPKRVDFARWSGYCAKSASEPGLTVDELIDELRGK